MPNEVYSGEGTYSMTSLTAAYRVYLPVPTAGTYGFYTTKIYNFSCPAYPNTILLFMKVNNGPNNALTGTTSQPATTVMFSLQPNFIENIDASCIPLNKTADIKVILMHDDSNDLAYAKATLYCVVPPVSTSVTSAGATTTKSKSATVDKSATEVLQSNKNIDIIIPKKFKIGLLKPKA